MLADRKARQFINVTKINPIADCFTDHKLLTAKCCFVVKKRRKTKPPSCPDISLNTEKKEKLELFLEEKLLGCEECWDDPKEVLQNAAKHVFEKRKKKNADWFDDQDDEILKDKKLCGDKSELKREIRKFKNGWFQQKACLAEQYAREKNHREFYAILNAIYGPKPRNLHPVR